MGLQNTKSALLFEHTSIFIQHFFYVRQLEKNNKTSDILKHLFLHRRCLFFIKNVDFFDKYHTISHILCIVNCIKLNKFTLIEKYQQATNFEII